MTSPASSTARAGLPARTRRLLSITFWGNLVCQIGIIVTGGVVRLTGSGLGCSTWPHCEPGQFTPRYHPEMGIRPFIEFSNRTLTVVLTVFAMVLLVLTYKHLRDKGAGFVRLAWVPLILTIVQALVGMVVVWLHLDPAYVAIHFIVSPVLIAASAVLVYRLYEGDGPRRPAVNRGALFVFWPLAAVAFVLMILGTIVTGSGPHSGDSTKPSRFPFNPAEIAWLHADVVWLLCGLIFGLAIALLMTKAHKPAITALWALVAITVGQGGIGYTQYFTGLPPLMVGLHMLGAALFSAIVAWVGSTMYTWHPVGEGTAPEANAADTTEAHA